MNHKIRKFNRNKANLVCGGDDRWWGCREKRVRMERGEAVKEFREQEKSATPQTILKRRKIGHLRQEAHS